MKKCLISLGLLVGLAGVCLADGEYMPNIQNYVTFRSSWSESVTTTNTCVISAYPVTFHTLSVVRAGGADAEISIYDSNKSTTVYNRKTPWIPLLSTGTFTFDMWLDSGCVIWARGTTPAAWIITYKR